MFSFFEEGMESRNWWTKQSISLDRILVVKDVRQAADGLGTLHFHTLRSASINGKTVASGSWNQ